jgi:hypothetical protein
LCFSLKSLYRSPGYKKKTNWSYVKAMSCSGSHLGITINLKNTKFVKDLPMIDAQFRPINLFDSTYALIPINLFVSTYVLFSIDVSVSTCVVFYRPIC